MLHHRGQGFLLDIEGTTSSVSFVYDVMFPFVRRELEAFLAAQGETPDVQAAAEQVARDAGAASFAAWAPGERPADGRLRTEVLRLMDADSKSTGLKQLQGLVWRAGFASGELRAQVYPDVAPAVRAWNAAGRDVRIYSSGSVAAQKLFFGHTEQGDLLGLFRGHYDTTSGPKREAASYARIAAEWGLAPAEILFLSDVAAELDAARAAGLATGLVLRPGNAPAPAGHGHAEVREFSEVGLQ